MIARAHFFEAVRSCEVIDSTRLATACIPDSLRRLAGSFLSLLFVVIAANMKTCILPAIVSNRAYLPDLPESEQITPRDLIMMTSGMPDYVPDAEFEESLDGDPFRDWTADDLIDFGLAQPRMFEPGTNRD